jgi:hypothetical protein
MAKLGDTFLLANSGINNHLLIIISDPAQDSNRIVMANFTSWRADKDQSCIVKVGEHRFITRRSCVHYGEDRLITLAAYEQLLASRSLSPHDPVSGDLLKRILDGAAVSPFLPLGNRQILVEQGLIDRE